MRRVDLLSWVPLAGVLLALPAPATAQSAVEGRVGKLESEMRAVQRKVFPGGGGGQYLQPDITAPDRPDLPAPGTPATSAVADLSSRVSSLEGQMATLTGQIEQQGYRQRQLQDAFDAYRRTTDARFRTMEGGGGASVSGTATGIAPAVDRAVDEDLAAQPSRPASHPLATASRPSPTVPRTTTRGAVDDAPAADMGHQSRTTAVVKPDTGDAAEDDYLYGYRLWQAKLYPEAQAQLKKAAAAGPKAKRYSFSQNLLGRAYLDDGKPSLASMAFYDNYKKAPDGERAPDSLLYLGQALRTLNKPADACKVYDELTEVYGAKLSSAMKADVVSGRSAAKCK